ncbi:MAG TPA: nucleotidyltransferase [Nanoarchaeota archaeon]|nr:nucleotidyltransferase [Nanoarchaeota archaeon]HIH62712.1 nucleotidyltransferase [Nanoarchaeota archaeon]HIJ09917.1 nucleotidyltransferase [Nanoarchaeota archaeon]
MELTKELILTTIKKNKRKLSEHNVKKIGLFGSFVKEQQKSTSDIDILIEFTKVNIDKYLYVLNLLEKLFNKKVDLVIEKNLKPELKYVIKEAEYVKI